MFRNKLLPALLIYKDKMQMQKTGSVEWFEFPLQLQFFSTIWFCAFLIYISLVLTGLGGWGSSCHRFLSSPVTWPQLPQATPWISTKLHSQPLIKLECPSGLALGDGQGGGCGCPSRVADEAGGYQTLPSRFFLPTRATPPNHQYQAVPWARYCAKNLMCFILTIALWNKVIISLLYGWEIESQRN